MKNPKRVIVPPHRKTEEFECCVMCGAVTCIPVSMPIDWRKNYQIGCGQLCAEGAKKLNKVSSKERALTDAQFLLAVELNTKVTDKK